MITGKGSRKTDCRSAQKNWAYNNVEGMFKLQLMQIQSSTDGAQQDQYILKVERNAWKMAPPLSFAWISNDLNKDKIAISSSPRSRISPS